VWRNKTDLANDNCLQTANDQGPGAGLRTAYQVWSGVAAGVFCIVAVTDLSTSTTASTRSTSGITTTTAAVPSPSRSTAPTADAAPTAVAAPKTSQAAPVGELVTVTKVVDGDTIEVTGGRAVRFLGIDACEMKTKGGREAKEYLEVFAGVGTEVRLIADGARDKDDHDRLLRRVERDSSYTSQYDPYSNDIGTTIVGHEAVGIYGGKKNDAGAAYLAKLRESDYGERDCSGTPEAPSSGGGSYGEGNDDDFNMPDGALTGGYCARKWWC
jgi:endonuclease YncB( thermonuclease family)